MVAAHGAEHWLLSNGFHAIRFDCVDGSLSAGPAPLRWSIDGIIDAEPAVLTLRRLLAVVRKGDFLGTSFNRETRAARWALTLRVSDAIAAGASQREIAEVLFAVSGPKWRVEAASWRLRVQRLVASARRFAVAGVSPWLTVRQGHNRCC